MCSLPLFFCFFFLGSVYFMPLVGLSIKYIYIYIYIYIYMLRFVEGPLMSNKIGFLVGNGRSRDFGRASWQVVW